MQYIVQKKGHRVLPLLALTVVMAALVFIAGNASAAPTGPFEIDVFPVDNSTSPPTPLPADAMKSYYSGNGDLDGGAGKADDWAQGASNNGVFLPSASAPHTATPNGPCYGSNIDINPAITYTARFICDGYTGISGSPELNIISPAGDIPQDIWPVTTANNLTPKDDLSHGYFAQLIQDCSGTPHNIVVVAMERGNNEGDNHWGIELDAVAPTGLTTVANNVSPAANFALDFNRQVGDVYVAVDLKKGGVRPDILVTQISGFLANGNATFVQASTTGACATFAANVTSTNLVEQTAAPWNTPACDPTTTDGGPNSCRIANGTGSGPVDQGSSSCKTATKPAVKQACTTVPARDFVEVAIDLTAYGITRGCFADVLLASVSSGAGSATPPAVDLSGADIKDITAAFLPPCDMTILKRDADTGQLIGPFTATISPNPFACKDADNVGPDDVNPLTVTDNVAPDNNSGLGTIHLADVCPGSYTSNETAAPPGYSLDPDGSEPANCTVTPGSSTSCTFTFRDPLGQLTILKRDDQGNPQGGATFSITPNVFACHQPPGTNPSPITDGGAGDPDGLANGTITLTRVCIPSTPGNVYTITETAAPPGFALPATVTKSCEVSENTNPKQQCSVTFQNRLGTLQWEKRVLSTGSPPHPLQGGATFSVTPNPFACRGGAAPGNFLDNAAPDADTDAGQIRLDRVCLGTYTITEVSAPTGSLKDEDDTRVITVDDPNVAGGTDELNPCVGTCTGSPPILPAPPGTDDDTRSPHGSGTCASEECDFHNRQASLIIRKEAKDASTTATNDLLGGAKFTITPNPFTGSGSLSIQDDDVSDQFATDGLICLDNVIPGSYSVKEDESFTNYTEDPATKSTSSSVGTCAARGTSATADVTFLNTPLSAITVSFTCLAFSPTNPGQCTTRASIVCTGQTADTSTTPPGDNLGENNTPDPAFDDTSEVFTGLVPGTYNCTVVIDP